MPLCHLVLYLLPHTTLSAGEGDMSLRVLGYNPLFASGSRMEEILTETDNVDVLLFEWDEGRRSFTNCA